MEVYDSIAHLTQLLHTRLGVLEGAKTSAVSDESLPIIVDESWTMDKLLELHEQVGVKLRELRVLLERHLYDEDMIIDYDIKKMKKVNYNMLKEDINKLVLPSLVARVIVLAELYHYIHHFILQKNKGKIWNNEFKDIGDQWFLKKRQVSKGNNLVLMATAAVLDPILTRLGEMHMYDLNIEPLDKTQKKIIEEETGDVNPSVKEVFFLVPDIIRSDLSSLQKNILTKISTTMTVKAAVSKYYLLNRLMQSVLIHSKMKEERPKFIQEETKKRILEGIEYESPFWSVKDKNAKREAGKAERKRAQEIQQTEEKTAKEAAKILAQVSKKARKTNQDD